MLPKNGSSLFLDFQQTIDVVEEMKARIYLMLLNNEVDRTLLRSPLLVVMVSIKV